MITASHVVDMLNHWLQTPPNGYFGSSYGCDLNSLLLNPLSTPVADSFVAKLKQDIPLFAELDISVLSEDVGFERKNIFLSIGTDYLINLNSIEQRPLANGEETQDANSA